MKQAMIETPTKANNFGAGVSSPDDWAATAAPSPPPELEAHVQSAFIDKKFVPISIAPNSFSGMNDILGLEADKPSVYTVLDLLQRIEDPRPLLAALRTLLLRNKDSVMAAAVPDGFVSRDDNGLRGWSPEEFSAFIESAGFEIISKESVASYIFIIARAGDYASFLKKNNLPGPDLRHLLITAEHSAFRYAGGIGSYAQEMERLLKDRGLGICFMGEKELRPEKLPNRNFTKRRRWLTPEVFFSKNYYSKIPKPDLVLEMVEQALFYWPGLEIVECQDCDGFGVRVMQAGRAGMLPSGLETRVRCHGTYAYLENAHKKWWSDSYHLKLMYEEKKALECADAVCFPTRFLQNFYKESDYLIDEERIELLRYPFSQPAPVSGNEINSPNDYRKIDSLIFFGSRTTMKGFPVFIAALQILLDEKKLPGVKKIAVIGSVDPALPKENSFIKSLRSQFEIFEGSLQRVEALAYLKKNADRALCVLPYLGDNHPNAVLEAMACRCRFIASDAGGIPELVPERFHDSALCRPEPESLAKGIEKAVAGDPAKQGETALEINKRASTMQQEINALHIKGQGTKSRPIAVCNKLKTAAVIRLSDSEDSLLNSLKRQLSAPEYVFVINETQKKADISRFKELGIPFEEASWADIPGLTDGHSIDALVNLDSCCALHPEFFPAHIRYMENNPGAAAATAYCFDDNNSRIIRPVGDGIPLLGEENLLGHGCSVFSAAFLHDANAWPLLEANDDCLSLFMKILSSENKIGVIPRVLSRRNGPYLFRPGFHSSREIGADLSVLNRFDAARFSGIMQDYREMQKSTAIAMARELERFPLLVKAGKWTLEKMAGVYFRIKIRYTNTNNRSDGKANEL